jgi:hypothetical protein
MFLGACLLIAACDGGGGDDGIEIDVTTGYDDFPVDELQSGGFDIQTRAIDAETMETELLVVLSTDPELCKEPTTEGPIDEILFRAWRQHPPTLCPFTSGSGELAFGSFEGWMFQRLEDGTTITAYDDVTEPRAGELYTFSWELFDDIQPDPGDCDGAEFLEAGELSLQASYTIGWIETVRPGSLPERDEWDDHDIEVNCAQIPPCVYLIPDDEQF